ncbi:phosphotransferase family enzyme [Nocardia tenerifensis]|uniref:Phosphotransferase family enzyme n=1 Tax=Nocardia tenerifensis TaxID=228006 RepID=A0A318K930_9NOCA|nr:phosphotransferase [Nocardia tenerifensis]PXX67008.1 phosphotransferase family enzyme [Nocardia tenerifensis]
MDATGFIEANSELLTRLLPEDRLSELSVREGQFHSVVVGSERVIAFARTAAAAQRLSARADGLRALARLELGVAVPECLSVEEAPPCLVMTKVAGAPLDEESLRDPVVAKTVARQCRDLLDQLAAAGSAGQIDIPAASVDRWREFADGVRAELYPLMNADGRERAERELAALDSLPHLTGAVVHGDLGGENLLWDNVDGLFVLRGVVDWDGVCLGDPAEDYAALGAGYGSDVLREMLALGPPDDDLAVRISVIQGTFALQQALAAHRDGDAEALADGLAGYLS